MQTLMIQMYNIYCVHIYMFNIHKFSCACTRTMESLVSQILVSHMLKKKFTTWGWLLGQLSIIVTHFCRHTFSVHPVSVTSLSIFSTGLRPVAVLLTLATAGCTLVLQCVNFSSMFQTDTTRLCNELANISVPVYAP